LKAAGNKQPIQVTLSTSVLLVIDRFIAITGQTRTEAIEDALTNRAIDTAEALPKLEELAKQRNEPQTEGEKNEHQSKRG